MAGNMFLRPHQRGRGGGSGTLFVGARHGMCGDAAGGSAWGRYR